MEQNEIYDLIIALYQKNLILAQRWRSFNETIRFSEDQINIEFRKNEINTLDFAQAQENRMIKYSLVILQKALAYKKIVADEYLFIEASILELEKELKLIDIDIVLLGSTEYSEEDKLITQLYDIMAKSRLITKEFVIPKAEENLLTTRQIWDELRKRAN